MVIENNGRLHLQLLQLLVFVLLLFDEYYDKILITKINENLKKLYENHFRKF